MRPSARSHRDGYDSGHSSRSGSHDSEQRDSAGEDAADGGISASFPKHSSTSPDPRTSNLEEGSERTGADVPQPSIGSAAHHGEPSPGSVERQQLDSPRSAGARRSTRPTARTPATAPSARLTTCRRSSEGKRGPRRRHSDGRSASGLYSEKSLRPIEPRRGLSQQQSWRRRFSTGPKAQQTQELPRPRHP